MLKRQVQVNGIQVSVEQDLTYGHAGSVWDGALVLIHHLNHMSQKYKTLFSNKNIIQLGAGTGILGLVIGCFAPKTVIITDFKQNLPLIDKNIKLNLCSDQTFKVQQLSWGDQLSMGNIQNKYAPDFIIGSQLAYDYKDIQLLLKTIKYFKKQNNNLLTFISYQKYQKQTVNLARQLQANHFKYSQISWDQMDPDFRDKFIGILVIEGPIDN